MTEKRTISATNELKSALMPKSNEWKRFCRVFFGRGVVILGVIIIFTIIVIAIFAPLLTPYDPIQPDASVSLQSPSRAHLLGTDLLGRDVLSRIMFGSRVALMVGVIATSIAAVFGVVMGLTAGYFGGWINTCNNEDYRCIDVRTIDYAGSRRCGIIRGRTGKCHDIGWNFPDTNLLPFDVQRGPFH